MAPRMTVRFLFPFAAVFAVFAPMGSPAIFGDSVTSCHMVTTSSEQVYLSFLSTDRGRATVYQTIWTRHGRQLLECSVEDEPSLVKVYQSFCEASHGNFTKHLFSGSQDFKDLQAESVYQILLESCPVLPNGPSPATWQRFKREAPKRNRQGEASLSAEQPKQDAEVTVAPSPEGGTHGRVKRGWTLPGTLWCGAGNSAENFTDLGIFQGTDLCCREHDRCTEVLTSWEFKYGIRNYRVHTISHCDCDYRFKRCLYDLNDTISTFVGITFFNLLEMPCFTTEEREGCQAWNWWGGCQEYGPAPFAVIHSQGYYNYTHPFSDEFDERYKLNATVANSTVSSTKSAGLNVSLPRRSKQGSLQPGRRHRKKLGQAKLERGKMQENRTRAADVPDNLKLAFPVPSPLPDVVKEHQSEYYSNYVEEQKFVTLEHLNGRTQSYLPNPTPSMAHDSTDQISTPNAITAQTFVVNPSIDQTGMVAFSTDQAKVTFSTTHQTSIVHLSTDQVSMNLPITTQNSMAHRSTDQPSRDLFVPDQADLVHHSSYQTHLVQSMEGQASAGLAIITDHLASSMPNYGQSIMSQPTSQPTKHLITGTVQSNHGQSIIKWSSTDTRTSPRMDASSTERHIPDMSMNKAVKEILKTSPATGDILTLFNSGNRYRNQETTEQTATHQIMNYVEDSTNAPDTHSRANARTQDPGLPTTKGSTVEGVAASVPPKEDPVFNPENIYLNEYSQLLQVTPKTASHSANEPQHPAGNSLPDKDKSSHHYVSKNCGCYRRLDQCEYKIAPKEEKFQLHNMDLRTLYHCNCTRRLARFLQRKKRPNEVQEVLSDFVSPSCFVLEPREVCSDGKSCKSVSMAVLAPSGHLKRTLRLIQKNSKSWTPLDLGHLVEQSGTLDKSGASLKVKRQNLKAPGAIPEPVKLYEQCLQRVRRPTVNIQT